MAKAKQIQIQTEYNRYADPLEGLITLHCRYKDEYGPCILLEQAVALAKHVKNARNPDRDVCNRAWETYNESAIVEDVAYRVVRKLKKEELRAKADLIRDIRTYIEDCLK